MAEIEERALARLVLVRRDRFRLEPHALGDRMDARLAVENTSGRFRLQPLEKLQVADQPDLGHFRVAGAELALGQRVERRRVGKHQRRLHEGADEVFSLAAH